VAVGEGNETKDKFLPHTRAELSWLRNSLIISMSGVTISDAIATRIVHDDMRRDARPRLSSSENARDAAGNKRGDWALIRLIMKANASLPALALVAMVLSGSLCAHGQTAPLTNSVSAVGQSAYLVNSQSNPTLILQRGVTYRFVLSGLFQHPFNIQTNRVLFGSGHYNNGVTGNGNTSGMVIFSVPQEAPDQLFYQCSNHDVMGGNLTIVSPPSPPPSGMIVDIGVTESMVTIRSIGASGWNAIPQFSSNLVENVWADVPSFNNLFENGTNTTTFDRLDPICGPNVLLRVRNEQQ
jgi:hypothetical protein